MKKEKFRSNDEIYNIEINLMDLSNLKTEDILNLYKENDRIINFSDIYEFLLSKDNETKTWPAKIKNIKIKKRY